MSLRLNSTALKIMLPVEFWFKKEKTGGRAKSRVKCSVSLPFTNVKYVLAQLEKLTALSS